MKYTVLAFALCAVSPAFAATDWTNYLKGMQDGCKIPNDTLQKKTTIPKTLHTSITKYTTKAGGDGEKSVDIRLKNATAFGKPITRIVLDNGDWFYSRKFHVYFNDGNFSKLKSKFSVKVDNQSYAVGAQKAWRIIIEEDQDGNMINTQVISVPYKGSNTNSYKKLMSDGGTLVVIHENGWWNDDISWGDEGSVDKLIFDSKNKRISCEFAFG